MASPTEDRRKLDDSFIVVVNPRRWMVERGPMRDVRAAGTVGQGRLPLSTDAEAERKSFIAPPDSSLKGAV
jgi:hypothetical protein